MVNCSMAIQINNVCKSFGKFTFNPNNTVVIFSGSMFTANYTFFPNGNCEISIRTLFVRRNISGIGRVERAERNFILSLSMEEDGKEMITVLQGRIQ